MNTVMSQRDFFDCLVAAGHIVPTGVKGYYGRGEVFEDIATRFAALVGSYSSADGAERLSFPPMIPRATLEQTGYLDTMPHFAGFIHCFCGDVSAHRTLTERVRNHKKWDDLVEMSDLAMSPAACYPLYPTCAGELGPNGRFVDLSSPYVFRRKPSDDPARMQSFRQRELVRLGSPTQVQEWRALWLERAQKLLSGLGLEIQVDEASDPFFGRSGKVMAASQRQQQLKFEISVELTVEEERTAISSFNYHRDHFGKTFGIYTHDGEIAHTACLGFGIERTVLTLLRTNGMDPGDWPAEVQKQLWT